MNSEIRNPKSELPPPAGGSGTRNPQSAILRAYLERHCRGRDAARPKWRIRAELRAAGLVLGAREFDQAAHDLAVETGCVGSSDAGFFWCAEREDFQAAYSYLVGRFRPMRERAEAVRAKGEELFPAEPWRPADMLFNPH